MSKFRELLSILLHLIRAILLAISGNSYTKFSTFKLQFVYSSVTKTKSLTCGPRIKTSIPNYASM